MDLPDIEVVVQWRATCDMCTLWQRFGRAARDRALVGRALFLVEPKHFDDEKDKAAIQKEKNIQQSVKRKRKDSGVPGPTKKAAHCVADGPNKPIPSKIVAADQPESTMRKGGGDLEAAMEEVINAGTRGFGCYRKPVSNYFENENKCTYIWSDLVPYSHTCLYISSFESCSVSSSRLPTLYNPSLTHLLRALQPFRFHRVCRR
jgi:superfamily II DNA/RNA helicase